MEDLTKKTEKKYVTEKGDVDYRIEISEYYHLMRQGLPKPNQEKSQNYFPSRQISECNFCTGTQYWVG